jgi:hypothetical protein
VQVFAENAACAPTRCGWGTGRTGRSWGRLILQDSLLTFRSADYEWSLPVSEITRLVESQTASRAFEVESASGQIYYVAILDSRMLTESPRKAVQTIRRAIREAPTTSRPATVARGSR